MKKQAEYELWKTLYNLIDELKELAPWNELYDMDLIGIQENGREEPVFCSITGHEDSGQICGVGLYEGTQGLACFQRLVRMEPGDEFLRWDDLMSDQQALMLTWESRIDVPKDQIDIIKGLGKKYRGKGGWPCVLSMKPRFAPCTPDEEELKVMIETFVQLIEAVHAIREERVKVDFEKGEFCFRYFDLREMNWMTAPARLPYAEEKYCTCDILDETEVKRYSELPKNDRTLLVDTAYLLGEFHDPNYDRPINPLLCIMVEVESHKIVYCEMIPPDQEEGLEAANGLLVYIEENGLPKKICVRNLRVAAALQNLCDKLSISLEMGMLGEIDEIVEQLRSQADQANQDDQADQPDQR